MPFVSQAQRAYMFQNHPDIAKRWESLTPKGGKLPEHHISANRSMKHANGFSESHETWKKGQATLPRTPEVKRDFGPLHPSAKARLKTSHTASTKEADEEDGVEKHPANRPGKMKLKGSHVLDAFAKRDVALAHKQASKFRR